jgi:hypothetical protein
MTHNPDSKIVRWFRRAAFLILLVTIVGVGTWFLSSRTSSIEWTPDGSRIKLERSVFVGRTVRYDLPNRPIAGALRKILPEKLTKKY